MKGEDGERLGTGMDVCLGGDGVGLRIDSNYLNWVRYLRDSNRVIKGLRHWSEYAHRVQ